MRLKYTRVRALAAFLITPVWADKFTFIRGLLANIIEFVGADGFLGIGACEIGWQVAGKRVSRWSHSQTVGKSCAKRVIPPISGQSGGFSPSLATCATDNP